MLVHKVDKKGFFIHSFTISDNSPVPKLCITTPLPVTITDGKTLQWVNKWIEVDPPAMTQQVFMIEADDLLDRFLPEEQLRISEYTKSTAPEADRGLAFSFYNRLITGRPINVLSPRFKSAIEFLNSKMMNKKKLVEDDYPQRILFEQLS